MVSSVAEDSDQSGRCVGSVSSAVSAVSPSPSGVWVTLARTGMVDTAVHTTCRK